MTLIPTDIWKASITGYTSDPLIVTIKVKGAIPGDKELQPWIRLSAAFPDGVKDGYLRVIVHSDGKWKRLLITAEG
jgi:hypothetical protein